MRNFVLLLLCCFTLAPAALAQQADLTVVSVTLDKNAIVTGERYTVTAQVRNNGPDAAQGAIVSFGTNLGFLAVSMQAPAGWTCMRVLSIPNSATCTANTFASGAVANFSVTALAPSDVAPEGSGVSANVLAYASTPDPVGTNNNRMVAMSLTAAPTSADLSIEVAPREVPAQPDTQTTVDIPVRNNGPSAVNDVVVAIDTTSLTDVALVGVSGNWVCTPTAQPSTLCRTSTIAAGATSTLTLRFRTPASETAVSLLARVQAEHNRDAVVANNDAFGTVFVGSQVNWRRVLLPVTAQSIPGANGALWKSDITALIRSAVPVEIAPSPCENIVVLCPVPPPPLNQPFDASMFIRDHNAPGGQFLYVKAPDEEKLRFNIRIYDQARLAETAGAEVPVARENDFTRGAISLLNIPVAPQFRHTLRVYDGDARTGARVLVHVYANDESTPRVTTVRTLEPSPLLERVTTAQLPTHPSYLQLQLADLTPLAGLESVRVEVEPVDFGLRLWAFVSITNNDTHHVTTVTPQ